jgi:Na+/H+ antiporter NhaC
VRTQLPYALTAGFLATVLGYLPAGFEVSPFLLLAIGAQACWLLVRYRGQRVEAPAPE